MSKFYCVYCGKPHESHNGTGSDVSCCGEVGHVEDKPIADLEPDPEVRITSDFNVYDGGSIILLAPHTEQARDWIRDNIPDDAQTLGNNIAIERRYFEDIYWGIKGDGLTIS